jgi:hypothetical protein
MLEITKNYVLDKDQKPIAVQIPIAENEISSSWQTFPNQAKLVIYYEKDTL